LQGPSLGSKVVTSENRPSHGKAAMRTFTLIEHYSDPYFQVIHEGKPISPPKKWTVGDVLLGQRPLRDPKTEDQVGVLVFHGTIIRVFPNNDALFGVNAEVYLYNGTIAVQSSFRLNSKEGIGAIVGGTGEFARAHGTVKRKVIDDDTGQFTYDYQPKRRRKGRH
jgi:Dirigent-like protein